MRILIFTIVLSLIGCEKFTKASKHIKSGWTGLNRKVTLFNCDGIPIKSWEGQFMIELQGNSAAWIDENNKEVKISGTFIIEEID